MDVDVVRIIPVDACNRHRQSIRQMNSLSMDDHWTNHELVLLVSIEENLSLLLVYVCNLSRIEHDRLKQTVHFGFFIYFHLFFINGIIVMMNIDCRYRRTNLTVCQYETIVIDFQVILRDVRHRSMKMHHE
jgi:hypothetical protein